MAKIEKEFMKRYLAPPIEGAELHKHIAVMNNRIYQIDTMKDITDQKFIQIYGQRISVRKAAFYLLNGRWPAPNFLLPWE